MKNKIFKFLGIISMGILLFSCQDMERPEFSDFLYDGPVITLTTPSPSGSTVVSSLETIAPITIKFHVEDDLGIATIIVNLDGQEIANINEFADNKSFSMDNLTQDVSTGSHTLTITATDTNDVVVTETAVFEKIEIPPYTPMFDGEVLYMAFDGNYFEAISGTDASEVGAPGFETGIIGKAYKGATDSYLTFPTNGLLTTQEFSGAFWYKVNASPDRSGILVIGANADNRNQGLRLFREGSGTEQRIKLNVGTGTGESWNDGGVIDVTAGDWVHIAFTISETENTIYINGDPVNTGAMGAPIDWTGSETLTIEAGGDTFSYWGHLSDSSLMDELHLFDKVLTNSEIQSMINQADETVYMPFSGNYENRVSGTEATVIGTPGFIAGKDGEAYKGATDSYLTYPLVGVFGEEFTVAFWYKVNGAPDRSGIVVVGNDTPENRNQGFRIFREGSATEQRIKSNIGIGTGEVWNDGDVIDVTAGEWVHIAITVSSSKSKIFFNGEEKNSSDMAAAIDWTDCTSMSIGSGAPTFGYWGHLSDSSEIDELHIFKKALTAEEIQSIM